MTRTIVIQEDGMFSTEPIPVQDLTNMALAAVTGVMQEIRTRYNEDPNAAAIDNDMFNFMNEAMSQALHNMFPDFDLHPDLTEEAILKAENEILAERVKEIKGQEATDEKVVAIQEHVAKHIDKE